MRPWLSPAQDMACRQMDNKLRRVLQMPVDSMPPTGDDPCAGVNLVAQVERDVIQIGELLRRHRTVPLFEEEWRELSQLVSRYEDQDPWLNAGLISRLAQREDLRSRFGDLSHKLRQRVAVALDYMNSCGVANALQRTSAELPIGEGKQVVVHSRVMPGTAFAIHLEDCYPPHGLIGGKRPPYKHALGLAQTSLINCSGQLLYSGLRNCPFQPTSPGDLLLQLDDEDLKSTIADLDVKRGRLDVFGQRHIVNDSFYAWRAELIEKRETLVQAYAHEMVDQAAFSLERDLLAAALVADLEKFAQAIDGKTVSLGLCVIQTGHETALSIWQKRVAKRLARRGLEDVSDLPWLHLKQGAPVAVRVRGIGDWVRSVPVVVQIREFGVLNGGAKLRGITTGPESASGCLPQPGGPGNTPAAGWTTASSMERLLGPADSRKLGGDVESRHVALHARLSRKRAEVGELERQYRQSRLYRDASHPACSQLLDRIETVRREAATIEKNARTLVEAGEQVKELLASLPPSVRRFPIPVETMVASRLALIGHLMGETPVLRCVDSRGAARLDAEVKFLATVADSNEGRLPPLHERPDAWRSARDQFRAGLAHQAGDFLDGTRWQSLAEPGEPRGPLPA